MDIQTLFLVLMVMSADTNKGTLTPVKVDYVQCGDVSECCRREKEARTDTVLTTIYAVYKPGNKAGFVSCNEECTALIPVPTPAGSPQIRLPRFDLGPPIVEPNTTASPS